jgi:CheY-like chemotaxis protein
MVGPKSGEHKLPQPATRKTAHQAGGARADFVASLGRKIADARAVLETLEARPKDPGPRDELRRKLHALASGAKLLKLEAMGKSLAGAESILDRAAKAGRLSGDDAAELVTVLDDLPALAWADPKRERESAREVEAPAPEKPPRQALIFGPELLAEALVDEGDWDGTDTFECERTEHVQAGIGLARSLAPDVVVVDADAPQALEIVEALLDDPLTEPVPIVVVGTFPTPEVAARYVALGVARTLPKPISPEELRGACADSIAQREGRTVRLALGEPTLEQLGERLADEVRNALVVSVDVAARGVKVPLGEGTEVLGAIWGAIARVREVVTSRTEGVVRFPQQGPEGAVALAPWLHSDVARGDRTTARGRGPAADVKLPGRRVIVADDDPGVTWFIADLLRTAGCVVHEALDGATALDLAFEMSPELVVSDILMPGLDGFALCRALKRDVALRDTPVVLLSWKEDLLQRVRELGASAAAYMRKETDSRAILARVREVLRPRARVEARLKAPGEVRGRLDGLTVRSLLEIVCAARPSSRILIRDASFLYEIEVREGAPRRITRTAGDGTFHRGPEVFSAMLGVGAGRFTVADSNEKIAADLPGALAAQLAGPIAQARGAAYATTGAHMMQVERVLLDIEAYLRATPEPARSLIQRLAEGASPRAILLGGEVDPALLEDVLADLAARGAIAAVTGAGGADLLAPAVDRARATMAGSVRSPSSAPPRSGRAGPPAESPPSYKRAADGPAVAAPEPRSATPSSLADAVMREISDRSPSPGTARGEPAPRPIVEPSALRPRSSSHPPDDEITGEAADRTDVDHVSVEPGADEPSIPIPIDVEASQPPVIVSDPFAATESAEEEAAPADEQVTTEPDARRRRAHVTDPTEEQPAPILATEVRRAPRQGWLYGATLVMAAIVMYAAYRMTPDAGGGKHPEGASAATVTFEDLPPNVEVSEGQGLLELVSVGPAGVKIDNEVRGRGSSYNVPLAAGLHKVQAGNDEPRMVEVQAGRATRLDLANRP